MSKTIQELIRQHDLDVAVIGEDSLATISAIAELESYVALGRALCAMPTETTLDHTWNDLWMVDDNGDHKFATAFEALGLPVPA